MNFRRRRGLGGWRRARSAGTRGSGEDSAAGGTGERVFPRLSLPRGTPGRLLLTIAALALFFGAGYLLSAAVLFPPPEEPGGGSLLEVPELVGLPDEAARKRVEGVGLGWAVRGSVHHPEAPEGTVLAQSPLPGQMARPGAPVRVTLSRGPERRSVPQVEGLSERQATIVLERLGFRPATREVPAEADRGRAVRTEPEAGTELTVPADVELYVSSGPPSVRVPDLAGRHVDDVPELLAAQGLALGRLTWDPLAAAAPGRVTGQYPPAGYSLREGGEVEVRVAGRPPAEGGR